MSDVMPDYHVEQQKVIVQISTLKTNLERNKLELMELESRKAQNTINKEALELAIKEHDEKLKSLVTTHGKPKDLDSDK